MRTSEWYFFLLLLLGVVVLVGFIFLPFLGTIALAAIFAVLLAPLQHRLQSYLGGRAGLASALTVVLTLIILFAPLIVLSVKLVNEAQILYAHFGDNGSVYWTRLSGLLGKLFGDMSDVGSRSWQPQFSQALSWVLDHFGSFFSGAAAMVLKLVLWLIALFYFLKDGERFKQSLIRLSPLLDTYDHDIIRQLATTINSVVRGALLVAVIQGLLTGVGLALFGVPNPTLWGAAAALAALIPGIGTALVLVPAIVFLFLTGPLLPALGLLVWGFLAVGLIDNLLAPALYSRGSQVHPFFMLLAVLGGLLFFGPSGFILGPVTLGLLTALVDIYQSRTKLTA